MFMLNYRYLNSNHTKPVQKPQRCSRCTSRKRNKGASNCIRITKETPSKSWLTVWMAANGCHCFWSVVRCPQVCLGLVCRLLFYVFLQLRRCHKSRLFSETKCVPLTEKEEQTPVCACGLRWDYVFQAGEVQCALHQSHPMYGTHQRQ